MKLSTMLRVNSTVDAEWKSPIAERILQSWEHDQESARFFRASTNFVYVFSRAGERLFLRFADSNERSQAAIEEEMTLLDWLSSRGMAVTTPIASKNRRNVETVETDCGTFHAVALTGLHGSQPSIEELSQAQFELWGAALGKLHALFRQYQEQGVRLSSRTTWKNQLTMIQSYLPKGQREVQAEFDHLTSFLASLSMTETNYGLIHGDFELDNLFWQDDKIAMLDFDDCSYSWYVTDIALALRDLFETSVDLNNPSFRAFICGYSKHSSPDEELLAHLPMFMRLTKLIQYAKLVRATDLAPDQDYPEWCASLLLKLENVMQRYTTSLHR